MTIPQELQDLKQWTYSYDHENLKRPKHSHYTPDGTLSHNEARNKAKQNNLSFGFYTTMEDPYILGDIDKMEDPRDLSSLHPQLAELISSKKFYCEISPSGKGIRFVGRLPKTEDKEQLRGKIYYTRYPREGQSIRECQINIDRPWQRFTGNELLEFSSGEVPTLTLEEWNGLFALKFKQDELPKVGEEVKEGVQHRTPSRLPDFLTCVKSTFACGMFLLTKILELFGHTKRYSERRTTIITSG